MKKILVLSAAAFLFSVSAAWAHSIWLERDASGRTGVCFGEYGEGLREKAGAKLDSVAGFEAWSVDAQGRRTALEAKAADDRFLLEGASGPVLVQHLNRPVRKPKPDAEGAMHAPASGKVSRSFLYARYSHADPALRPEMKLDVVPTGANGHVVAFFEGKPLAGLKGTLTAPNGWSKELRSDEQGRMTLETPWPGLYLLEASHETENAGNFEGVDYESEKHRIAFSFVKD